MFGRARPRLTVSRTAAPAAATGTNASHHAASRRVRNAARIMTKSAMATASTWTRVSADRGSVMYLASPGQVFPNAGPLFNGARIKITPGTTVSATVSSRQANLADTLRPASSTSPHAVQSGAMSRPATAAVRNAGPVNPRAKPIVWAPSATASASNTHDQAARSPLGTLMSRAVSTAVPTAAISAPANARTTATGISPMVPDAACGCERDLDNREYLRRWRPVHRRRTGGETAFRDSV